MKLVFIFGPPTPPDNSRERTDVSEKNKNKIRIKPGS